MHSYTNPHHNIVKFNNHVENRLADQRFNKKQLPLFIESLFLLLNRLYQLVKYGMDFECEVIEDRLGVFISVTKIKE
jgi:hypothetical protein